MSNLTITSEALENIRQKLNELEDIHWIKIRNYYIKGELEDICGQLGDIEGSKIAEEVIERIQRLFPI